MSKQHDGSGVTGALLLIGLGALIMTGWWWPGIMVVLGIAVACGLVYERRFGAGLVAAAVFFSIPFLAEIHLQWSTVGPVVLIALGVLALAKTLLLRKA